MKNDKRVGLKITKQAHDALKTISDQFGLDMGLIASRLIMEAIDESKRTGKQLALGLKVQGDIAKPIAAQDKELSKGDRIRAALDGLLREGAPVYHADLLAVRGMKSAIDNWKDVEALGYKRTWPDGGAVFSWEHADAVGTDIA